MILVVNEIVERHGNAHHMEEWRHSGILTVHIGRPIFGGKSTNRIEERGESKVFYRVFTNIANFDLTKSTVCHTVCVCVRGWLVCVCVCEGVVSVCVCLLLSTRHLPCMRYLLHIYSNDLYILF